MSFWANAMRNILKSRRCTRSMTTGRMALYNTRSMVFISWTYLLLHSLCLAFFGMFSDCLTIYEYRSRYSHSVSSLPSGYQLFWDIVRGVCPVMPRGSSKPGWPFDLKRPAKYSCMLGFSTQDGWAEWMPVVHIMNTSTFLRLIQKNTSNSDWCLIVNFFAPYCPFSARLAPFYNALPRVFSWLYVAAVDATEHSRLNNRYGIAGTPTVLLWHNGKAIARYEDPDYSLTRLANFVSRHTDLEVLHGLEIEDNDMFGPLPTKPVISTDWYLVCSWIFIIVCSVYYGLRSSMAESLLDTIRRAWNEANENAEAHEEAVREENEETARLRVIDDQPEEE